jgi:dephospho-CoA kinase
MAIKVGITGGIGSGKSVVCEIFRLLGVPVFNSDLEGREILRTHPKVISEVKKIFGPAAYSEDEIPDRKLIAAIAFSDPVKLAALNAVIHPAVNERFEEWCAKHADAAYVIKEAAILVESGAHKQMDLIVVVSAPETLRFKRAMKRDNISAEEVTKRSLNQLPEEELRKYADFIILNDEDTLLIPQVLKVHQIVKSNVQPRT